AIDFLYSSRCSLDSQYDHRSPFTKAKVTGMMTFTFSNVLPCRHRRARSCSYSALVHGRELMMSLLQTCCRPSTPVLTRLDAINTSTLPCGFLNSIRSELSLLPV